MGSTISNVLGAFSLGLFFFPQGLEFDRSAKIYSALLFVVTTLFVALTFFNFLNQIVGGILIAIFAVYVASIICAICKGVTWPPELSDSDSDGESNDSGGESINHAPISETSPLIENEHSPSSTDKGARRSRSLTYHAFQLMLGFISLSLSGYILSRSAVTIADSVHLSGTVFGLTVNDVVLFTRAGLPGVPPSKQYNSSPGG